MERSRWQGVWARPLAAGQLTHSKHQDLAAILSCMGAQRGAHSGCTDPLTNLRRVTLPVGGAAAADGRAVQACCVRGGPPPRGAHGRIEGLQPPKGALVQPEGGQRQHGAGCPRGSVAV